MTCVAPFKISAETNEIREQHGLIHATSIQMFSHSDKLTGLNTELNEALSVFAMVFEKNDLFVIHHPMNGEKAPLGRDSLSDGIGSIDKSLCGGKGIP